MRIRIRVCLLGALCCLLAGVPAMAKKHAAAEHSRPAAPSADHETIEIPGKVLREPNAFHGIKWGTAMAAVPDLTVVEKNGQAAYATSPEVVYRIGDVFLNNVVYAFCQDKFAAVMVEYRGRKTNDNIRKFLTAKYTEPVRVEGQPDEVGWPIGNVLIRMSFSGEKDMGSLSYFYQPLFDPCSGADAAPKATK